MGERPYPHAIVAGVERYPRKVTRRMGKKKLEKRSKVKPFIKSINYNHLMPTRYALEADLKTVVSNDALANATNRSNTRKEVKKVMEEKYAASMKSGKNKW